MALTSKREELLLLSAVPSLEVEVDRSRLDSLIENEFKEEQKSSKDEVNGGYSSEKEGAGAYLAPMGKAPKRDAAEKGTLGPTLAAGRGPLTKADGMTVSLVSGAESRRSSISSPRTISPSSKNASAVLKGIFPPFANTVDGRELSSTCSGKIEVRGIMETEASSFPTW